MSYDGLRGCANCGNDTTGRLCTSCAHQEMIDSDPNPPPIIECWCELCGFPLAGQQSGKHEIDVCQSCFDDIARESDGRDNWDEHLTVHSYLTD